MIQFVVIGRTCFRCPAKDKNHWKSPLLDQASAPEDLETPWEQARAGQLFLIHVASEVVVWGLESVGEMLE